MDEEIGAFDTGPDDFAALKPPTREQFFNTIAELELRLEKLEKAMQTAKTGMPSLPWE